MTEQMLQDGETAFHIPSSLALHLTEPVETPTVEVGADVLSVSDAFTRAANDLKDGPLQGWDGQLAALYYQNSSQARAMSAYIAATEPLMNAMSADGRYVLVDVASKGDGGALLAELQAAGLVNGSSYGALVSGWLPVANLGALLEVDNLSLARQSGAMSSVGSVTTQADAVHRADVARTTYGVDGTGVRVGVLSDSFNNLRGAPNGVASGDLPVVQVLQDLDDGSGSDEGRGMAELVHDLAPGSPISFATAFNGQAGFANNITALQRAGSKVIVDDIIYFAELMYQDGVIAQAATRAVDNGSAYFSSAGNNGFEGWQGAFVNGGAQTIIGRAYTMMQFNTGENFLGVNATRTGVPLILQWDSPGRSAGGTGATVDLDLFITNADGTTVRAQSAVANIGGDPVEIVTLPTGALQVRVGVAPGSPLPSNIRLVGLSNGGGLDLATTATNTNAGAVFGHAEARGAVSVAASSYATGNVNPVVETFSSRGTVTIYFDAQGNRLAVPELRNGPELTGIDGGNTTFFGDDDSDADIFPNFYGTSAAAPDVAAIAALMLQANPQLTPADITNLLQASALDMQDPFTPGTDPGFDVRTGAGLVFADRAVQFARTLAITNASQTTLRGTHLGDTITGSAAADTIYGEAGNDTINAGDLADTVFGGVGNDIVNGGAGLDVVRGDAGDDTLSGEADNDTLYGDGGEDTLIGGLGDDTLNGGEGANTVSFANSAAGVTVILNTDAVAVTANGEGTDTLSNIQNLIGSAFNDSFTVTNNSAENNVFFGGAGNDTLNGGYGDDLIDGGADNDTLNGGTQNQPFAIDTVSYDSATAAVTVSLAVTAQQNTIGAGLDTIANFERLIGSRFGDTLTSAANGSVVLGGEGADTINGGVGVDTLEGGVGDDTLNGNAGADTLVGGDGRDIINGAGGLDVIRGEVGDDVLSAGDSRGDLVDGGAGNDLIVGGSQIPPSPTNRPDIVKTQATANTSIAAAVSLADAFDLVENANIRESANIPHATVNATSNGGGAEFYRFTAPTANTRIIADIDASAIDTVVSLLSLDGTLIAFNDDAPVDPGSTASVNSLLDFVIPNAGEYLIRVHRYTAAPAQTTVSPLIAASTYTLHVSVAGAPVEAGPGNFEGQTLVGGIGDDVISSSNGGDALDGGADRDVVSYNQATAGVTVSLALQGTPQDTRSMGGDVLLNFEDLTGSQFNDALTGDGGSNAISGLAGGDVIDGGGGNDTLEGGSGADTLIGGAGNDLAVFGGTFSQVSIVFRGNSIVVNGPDGYDTLIGVERFQFGAVTIDRDAADGLDNLYYYAMNPDVLAAGIDADAHFAAGGQGEGRNPNAFFNRAYYLANNPDLPNTPTFDAYGHYLVQGWLENRNPSAVFDTSDYLDANPDVRAAGINPLLHYVQGGGDDGRQRYVLFDDSFYLAGNPDIAAAGVDPYAHWLGGGRAELRDPHPLFDADGYRATYPDTAGTDPLTHYLTVGWTQGRDPSTRFDTTDYLTAYPDVAAANVNPLLHYLLVGRAEGRLAFDDGVWG